jgi:hypothetical protein
MEDNLKNAIKIFKNIVIPEPDHARATLRQGR